MMSFKQRKDKDQISKPEQGEVRVNQRGLVRKILSRYSYDFAVFRELLQNSDDARSDNVIIRFEETSGIAKCIVENSGDPFVKKDWDRLTEIANGNPDSGKVGAFGVGFYSIFSLTDRPVILSGGRKMEFQWEGEAGPLNYCLSKHHTSHKGAIIQMPLKNPEIPEKDELFRFLATSITFMTHLNNVEVFRNKVSIGRISKSKEKVEEDNRPPIEMKPVSPSDMRFLEPLGLQHRQFTIEYFPDPKKQPNESSKLGLSIFSIEAGIEMDRKLKEELFQCTFKDRAPQVKYSLIYTGKDEYDQSSADITGHSLIFRELRADLNDALCSKIFIGHSTRQTTGVGGHMESQFIPTVERESIDLVDKNIAIWNNSLLYLGSFLSRVVYELELSNIQTTWIRLNESEASETSNFRLLHERFIHVLKFFTVRPSTPSPKVAEKLCASFYTCSTSPLRLLSSVGVQQVSDIRLYDNLCEKFLKDVPMLSSDFNDLAVDFVKAQLNEQEIQRIKPSDVKHDLQKHALDCSKGELVACLQWILREWAVPGLGVDDLLKVARFRDANKIEVPLSSIQHFINPKKDGAYIPLDGPLPRSVLPHQITRSITPAELERFKWREFTVINWLLHVSSQAVRSEDEGKHDFTKSLDWAARVLHCVSLAWSSGGDLRRQAVDVFKTERCIPTTHGLRTPERSCLPNSDITKFDNLDFPMVQLPSGPEISGEMVDLLVTLGVKRHPPVQLVLKQEKWETSALIDYLVRISASLSDSDIEDLKSSSIFAKDNGEDDSEMSFRANQLYPPTEIFQKLGLPLIDWGGPSEWHVDSSRKEVDLLYRLDLNRFPSLEEIITLSQDAKVGEVAFEYLCNNFRKKYSDRTLEDFQDTAFVPMESRDGIGRGKLGEVFLNKKWKEFGFPVVLPGYEETTVEDLGVQHHPPPSSILRQLEQFAKDPSSSEDTARRWFSILSDHVSKFQTNERYHIAGLSIVPAITREGQKTMLTPVECYLGQSAGRDLYLKLFHFVDFGSGDKFLRACGAKSAPTKEDVAQKLMNDPDKFYNLAGGHRHFLQVLLQLASGDPSISNVIVENMKTRPILLGIMRKPEEAYVLKKPREIVIVDDERTYQLFADSIVAAPRNMPRELEGFYMLLGCQPLTTAIQDQADPFGELELPGMCEGYRELLLKRLPIFLHNYPHLKPGTRESRFYGVNAITVKVWEKLSVSKTITVAKNATTNEQSVSATAICKQKTLQIWLTRSAKQDIVHDLAVSLCRVFLGTENPPDVEFLTNCLSETLEVLKRRGYEINQQRLDDWGLPRPANPSSKIASEKDHNPTSTTSRDTTTQIWFPGGSLEAAPREVCGIPSHDTSVAVLRQSSDLVMHRRDIETTIEAAIQACKSKQQMPLSPHTDPNVNKFLDGYCDVSSVDNLKLFRRVRDVDIHVAQDFPDVDTSGACIPELLSHFLDILEPIAKVYGLSTKSYCIFATAGCIAFNRQGTIYLNLQYFEKWREYDPAFQRQYAKGTLKDYKDVCEGRRRRALTLWFLTFAHEVAHNLVTGHDSEHEFWFLAICEKYMDKFSRLLGSVSA